MSIQSVRNLPIGLYGAVMGLEGLGLACRSAAAVLPVPVIVAEVWVMLGILALAVLLPAYLVKLVRYPLAVRDEFMNPAQIGFCGALPIGMTLVGGGLKPYAPALADAIWWAGVVLLFLFQVWALRRFLAGGIELSQVNGGWLIIMVGGIVVPGSGIALGHPVASGFMFGLSTAVAPIIVGLVFYRTVVGPALPELLRPTWFIFLVPPSLIYANGVALSGEPAGIFLNGLFYVALVLAPALLIAARSFLRWPFGAPWWAFTFPLDALATAAVHHAQVHPLAAWIALAATALAIAVFFILVVLMKTLLAVVGGEFSAAPG
jgi:tellurite resistance protein